MEVQFTPDIEARLAELATRQQLSPDKVVQDVVSRNFEDEDRYIEAVKRGEAALERGEYLTHEQVGNKLRRFLER